jgi:hypothetical protein
MFRSAFPVFPLALSLLLGSYPVGAAEPGQDDSAALPPIEGEAPAQGEVSVDLNESTPGLTPEVYRETLRPHGDWQVSSRYGEVWRPRVGIGWRPYYYGAWLWTDEGWYWDSEEPFAWAVYHYGRWVLDPAWGWVWIPGYQWAPAWVAWRFGAEVVGWAPLGPGVSVFVTSYPFIDTWWTFVPTVRFVGVPIHTVAYSPRDTHRYFRATAPAPPRALAPSRSGRPASTTGSPAWGGPSRRVIEERTGRAVETTRRSPAWGAGSREERGVQAPRWSSPPSRHAPERERPGLAPSRRDEAGRQSVRPGSRDEEVRRPSIGPSPRSDGERRRTAPPPSRGSGEEPRRQKHGRER